MKQPTLSQFTSQLQELTGNLSAKKLQEIILKLGEKTSKENRSEFIRFINQMIKDSSHDSQVEVEEPLPDIGELLTRIEDYRKRMENGDFYDEERDYMEYHKEEYGYYRNRYNDYEEDDDDYDYSGEEYVIEMDSFLDSAADFYDSGNFEAALKVYEAIFSIIDDRDNSNDEFFSWNFSFSKALGENNYIIHKILFLRVFYMNYIKSDQKSVFNLFSNQLSILLSDIADAEKEPLPGFSKFTGVYINYLLKQKGKTNHLIDAIFVKGGLEELRSFSYKKGDEIPDIFLAYYNETKERGAGEDELLKIALDGIHLIPEKYASRARLSKDVISYAEKTKDKNLLLTGYSSAFYSSPELASLNDYLGYIMQNSIKDELEKFTLYLDSQKGKMSRMQELTRSGMAMNRMFEDHAEISLTNYLLSLFIIHGLKDVIQYNDYSFLGFQNEKKHIPAIIALLLITVTANSKAPVIEMLANKYCFNSDWRASINLRRLVYEKALKESTRELDKMTELIQCEELAIKRVQHILQNKLRGGYESSCLLLTACAEAKQIIDRTGNILINNIDNEFKRYTAFRRELKVLTKQSRVLATVT